MTLDEMIDGRDAEEMTVFDIDWEDDEFIIACIAGAPYKQLVGIKTRNYASPE